MPKLLNIKFSNEEMPALYLPGPAEDVQPEEFVLAQREDGEDIGFVAGLEWVSQQQMVLRRKPLKSVVRRATPDEKEVFFTRRALERKALTLCKEKAEQQNLPMKVTAVRVAPADGRLVFQFTSEQRVDFRQLVRELSLILHTRIELWQIGVRDEARMVDGFGICGLRTCCSSWLTDFRPISIRMAKEQDINLPPGKLSGQCGRLLCCLSYEVDQYKAMGREMLPKGATITVEGKPAVIVDRNIIACRYQVAFEDGSTATVAVGEVADGKVPEQMKRMATSMKSRAKTPPPDVNATPVADDEDIPPPPREVVVSTDSSAALEPEEAEGEEGDSEERRNRRRRRRRGGREREKPSDGPPAAKPREAREQRPAPPPPRRSQPPQESKPLEGAADKAGDDKGLRGRRRRRGRRGKGGGAGEPGGAD